MKPETQNKTLEVTQFVFIIFAVLYFCGGLTGCAARQFYDDDFTQGYYGTRDILKQWNQSKYNGPEMTKEFQKSGQSDAYIHVIIDRK